MIDRIYELIDDVRTLAAPDPRTEVFEIHAAHDAGCLVLDGCTTVASAVEELLLRIRGLGITAPVDDQVERLVPAASPRSGGAVITAAAAPVLAGPLISESPLSQLPMGHTVDVLRRYGRWCQVRMEDGNIGWVHRGYLREYGALTAENWSDDASAPLHLSLGCDILASGGDLLFRLPLGARIARRDDVALLPDGRTGIVVGDTVALEELGTHFPATGDAIVRTARGWMGTPYLWGGVTPWGADCSGLVQTVFRIHGIPLPRDSDQQVTQGAEIDAVDDFRNLEPGDLLFFAERSDRISHVAISAGGSTIIHSALGNGGVASNDLAGDDPYERELRSYYVRCRRVIEAGS